MTQDNLRICYISNSASPSKNASSLQIAKLCEYLVKNGNKVKLVLPDTGLKKNFYKYYDIKYKYKIIRLKTFRKFPIGVNYYLYSFFAILNSDIKKNDLYITRNFFTSFLLSALNKKHVLEVHDDIEIEGRIIKFLVKYFKILNNRSLIKIVTTTKTLKKKYKEYGTNVKKLEVIHNSSSLIKKFKKYKKKHTLNIGYFGSIFNSRGIEMIIRLSKLDKKNKYFIFGGTNKEIKELKKDIFNKNIFFSKYIPYAKVLSELNKIDICILPYTSKITVSGNVGDISKFTSPLKIFDYMKLGKLIICSNLPVLREVLIDKKNCILVNNFKNEKNWINVINKVSSNYGRFTKIRKNAFNFANRFDLKWRVSKILSFKKFSN